MSTFIERNNEGMWRVKDHIVAKFDGKSKVGLYPGTRIRKGTVKKDKKTDKTYMCFYFKDIFGPKEELDAFDHSNALIVLVEGEIKDLNEKNEISTIITIQKILADPEMQIILADEPIGLKKVREFKN